LSIPPASRETDIFYNFSSKSPSGGFRGLGIFVKYWLILLKVVSCESLDFGEAINNNKN